MPYTGSVAIPEEIRADAETAIGEFCRQHSSAEGADAPRYTYAFETNALLLLEQRPSFMKAGDWTSKPIARFRYSEARNVWSVYWRDANDKWHRVSNVVSEKNIRTLLDVVVKDPVGVFWS